MSNDNTHVERRRYPRVKEELQLKLKAEDFDAVAETMNLSCIGAYCQLKKYIPLMTSVKIALTLPDGTQATEIQYAECSGVVVRVEKVPSPDTTASVFNTAIYFNELAQSEKEKIAKFVERHRREKSSSQIIRQ